MAFLDESGLAELWRIVSEKDAELDAKSCMYAQGVITLSPDANTTVELDFAPSLLFVSLTGVVHDTNTYDGGAITWLPNTSANVYYATAMFSEDGVLTFSPTANTAVDRTVHWFAMR